MAQQILAVLERNSSRPESPTERVLQIVNPYVLQPQLFTSSLPGLVIHAFQRLSSICENIDWMDSSHVLDYLLSDFV